MAQCTIAGGGMAQVLTQPAAAVNGLLDE